MHCFLSRGYCTGLSPVGPGSWCENKEGLADRGLTHGAKHSSSPSLLHFSPQFIAFLSWSRHPGPWEETRLLSPVPVPSPCPAGVPCATCLGALLSFPALFPWRGLHLLSPCCKTFLSVDVEVPPSAQPLTYCDSSTDLAGPRRPWALS